MATEYLPREIAFWGPSSSGKTWLMQSLARSLHKINQDDPEFEYILAQPEALAPISAQAPQNQATSDAYDKVWLFQRKVRPEHDTPAHRLSAHCHSIVVRDAPGELLMQGVNNVVMVPLRDAQCVIAVLDPSLIDAATPVAAAAQPERAASNQSLAALFGAGANAAANAAPTPSFGTSFQYTQAQYTQMMSNLLQLLSSAPRPDRHVAVCVTKVDQLGVQGRSPWQVIEVFFGADMVKLLKGYAGKMEIEAFCVSAAGYLDAYRQQPNYDPGTRSLLSPDRWQPFAVETPFFWLFRHLERQRLAQGGGRVPRWYFHQDRLARYIDYPTRVY
jgi:GTPase SAR1 family protein